MSPSKRQRPTTGKGKAKGAGAPSSGPAPLQRLGLLVFGIAFVLLFAGFAIVQGIGQPTIPSGDIALVQGVPAELGSVTKADFNQALVQAAGQGGIKKVPKPGEKQYEDLKKTALGSIFDSIWIQGEAEELGVTVTPKQIADEFKSIKSQNFKTKAEYAEFLKTSHLTQAGVDERVKLQVLSTEIQKMLGEKSGTPSSSEVQEYYDEAKAAQFTQKRSRDIRIVVTKTKSQAEAAKALLEKDDSPKSWEAVAKKYSQDPGTKTKGGLNEGITEGSAEEPLNKDFFSAPEKTVQGVVKGASSYYVFEVEKSSPESVQPLAQVRSQITSQLQQTAQQEGFTEFLATYSSKWQARTFCASGYVIERCANYKPSGHPTSAPPGCYEANPKGGIPDACPAPVQQVAPALPGTVSILVPKGQPLPQRPQPEGLKATPAAGLTPEIPGATGAAPGATTAAP